MVQTEEKQIRKVFIVSLILKGLTSFLELIGGILFLFTGTVSALLTHLIQSELVEDPTDFVASHIQHYLPYLAAHTQLFAAVYLLSHGIIKLFLVVNLLRGKMWAYPAMIVGLFLFVVYQVYRLAFTHSVFLVILTLFDLLIILLTAHEYKVESTKAAAKHIK